MTELAPLAEQFHVSYGYEPSLLDEARSRTREHVRAIARLIDGEDVAIVRTTSFGARIPDVETLSGLEAAVRVRDAAVSLLREYAITARGEGACWATVGAALGLGELVQRNGDDLAESAFRFVTEGRVPEVDTGWSSWRSPVRWTCATCGSRVTDHGPFQGHPDDAEPGHTTACGRRARAIARLRPIWADENDNRRGDQTSEVPGPAAPADLVDEDGATGGISGRW